jgi:hypothetical protein
MTNDQNKHDSGQIQSRLPKTAAIGATNDDITTYITARSLENNEQ